MSLHGDERQQRLFFALCPDEGVRDTLDRSAGKLLGKQIKRIAAANLHLTLAFAGSANGTVRACLEMAAGAVQVPGFALCLDRLDHWQKPRILWAGPTHIPAELWSLAGLLRQTLEDCGIKAETRPYQPHVTLARKPGNCPQATGFPALHWSISHFSLVESVANPAGVRYRVLRTWALGSR